MAVANLQDAPVPLVALRDSAKKELLALLDTLRGRKVLVLDPALSGPLGLVADVASLREHGVDKMYLLEAGPCAVVRRARSAHPPQRCPPTC